MCICILHVNSVKYTVCTVYINVYSKLKRTDLWHCGKLLNKWPCQEDGSEDKESHPDDETDSANNNPHSNQPLCTALAVILCRAELEECTSCHPRYVYKWSFQESCFWNEADYSGLVYAVVITCTCITWQLLHVFGIGKATLTEEI